MSPELAKPVMRSMREDNELFLWDLLPQAQAAELPAADWYRIFRFLGMLDRSDHIPASDFEAHEIGMLLLAEIATMVGKHEPNVYFFAAQTCDGSSLQFDDAGEILVVVEPELREFLADIVPNFVGTCLPINSDLTIQNGRIGGSAETRVGILGWVKLPLDQCPSMRSIKNSLRSNSRYRIECWEVPKTEHDMLAAVHRVWPMPFACRTSNPFDLFRVLATVPIGDLLLGVGGGAQLRADIMRSVKCELGDPFTPRLTSKEARKLWALPVSGTRGAPSNPTSDLKLLLPSVHACPNDTQAERKAKARLASLSARSRRLD